MSLDPPAPSRALPAGPVEAIAEDGTPAGIGPRIAIICGHDAVRQGAFDHDRSNQVPLLGNNDSRMVLDKVGIPWARFHLAPNYFKRDRRWRFAGRDLIWNTISDADVNPRTLAVAARVMAASGLDVVNPPGLVARTTRDENARRLQGIAGTIVPKTIRIRRPSPDRVRQQIDANGLRFPLIVRRAGSHTGEIVGLFAVMEDFASIAGDRKSDFYATEFVDYRSADGLYRKWRIFSIGDRLVLRHVLMADSWKINASVGSTFLAERPDLRDEERGYFDGGIDGLPAGTLSAINEIRRRVALDYFGIDFGLMPSGDLLLFEANATMNFFPISKDPKFAYRWGCRRLAADAARALIESRVRPRRAVDERPAVATLRRLGPIAGAE